MDRDVLLPSGRLRVRSWGDPGNPLLLCVPGLAANLAAYSYIAPELAGYGRHVVALDLRGTGRSEVTAPGTYGLAAHALDVLGVADELGAQRFDLAGWSLGALIAMQVAADAGDRLRSVTLIDHAGPTDPAALVPIVDGLARLDLTVRDPAEYVDAVRTAGLITPWTPFWDNFFRYELGRQRDGQWHPTTSRAAAEEDLRQRWPRDWSPYWTALTMPAVLVRARQPHGGPIVVPQRAVDALVHVNPAVGVVPVPATHFSCMTEPGTRAALAAVVSAGQD